MSTLRWSEGREVDLTLWPGPSQGRTGSARLTRPPGSRQAQPSSRRGGKLRVAEEGLRQSAYYEALIRVSPTAIATADGDFVVRSWNPAAVALFGYSEDEAIGRHIDALVAA